MLIVVVVMATRGLESVWADSTTNNLYYLSYAQFVLKNHLPINTKAQIHNSHKYTE